MAATKVELFDRIRHDSWREGLSVRALARKLWVHRRLVREALAHAALAPRKTPLRRSPQLEPLKEIIDGWLRADLDAPRLPGVTAGAARAIARARKPGHVVVSSPGAGRYCASGRTPNITWLKSSGESVAPRATRRMQMSGSMVQSGQDHSFWDSSGICATM